MPRGITDLAILVLTTFLIWHYYRARTFPASEKYSTFGPRFWTASVDACVLWPLTFAITSLLALDLPRSVNTILSLIQETAWLAYSVVLHAKFGQTYGKMVCKVRVVDFATEGPISVRQAILRESIPIVISFVVIGYDAFATADRTDPLKRVSSGLFWLFSMLPGLWFIAEVLTMLTNEKRRALHDFIAGTVVVRTNVESETPDRTHSIPC